MMNWQVRSSWTPSSEYLIDLERGSIYHSRTANHSQKRRLFSTEHVGGDMKHFGIPQAADFIKKIKTAELYLGLLRSQAITELGRGVFQASNSYLRTHQRFFDYPINTLSYPIAQHIGVGFVRSSLDRQKLYDWITNMVDRSIIYGQTKYSQASKESIADELRKIAFAPPQA